MPSRHSLFGWSNQGSQNEQDMYHVGEGKDKYRFLMRAISMKETTYKM
jgi:hypothetical protein